MNNIILKPDTDPEEIKQTCLDNGCNELEAVSIARYMGTVFTDPITLNNAWRTIKVLNVQRGFLQGFAETMLTNLIGDEGDEGDEDLWESIHEVDEHMYQMGIYNLLEDIPTTKEFLSKKVNDLSIEHIKHMALLGQEEFNIPTVIFTDLLRHVPFFMGYFSSINYAISMLDEDSMDKEFKDNLESGAFYAENMPKVIGKFLGEVLPKELLFKEEPMEDETSEVEEEGTND